MKMLFVSINSSIIISLYLSLLLFFYSIAPAAAQSFKFYDLSSNSAVTSGFTFVKNSGGNFSYPQIYQGRLWFAEPLTLEKPAYVQFTFLSDNYSINYSKTSSDVAKIIKGELAARSSNVYNVYLSSKNNNSYSNSNQPGVKLNFGSSPYTANGGSGVKTQINPYSTSANNYNNSSGNNYNSAYSTFGNSANKFGGSYQTTQTLPFVSTVQPSTGVTTQKNIYQSTSSQPSVPTQADTRGGVTGYVSGGSTPFGGESVIVSVTNSKNQYIKSEVVNTQSGTTVYPYSISGIPPILPGSNDYYRVNVVSNNGFQSNPYSSQNIKIYSNGQTVQAQPIVMQAYRGKLNITLYHNPPALNESESYLSQLAQNAVINISGSAASARFTGESPARFYRYTIDDAPSGRRQLIIMFPGHKVSGGDNPSVTIPVNSTASILYNLSESR